MTRTIDFADGFESSASPTAGEISASKLSSFADDTAFETDKGSAGTAGDFYFNTTSNLMRLHDGTQWNDYVDSDKDQSVGGDKTLTGTTTTVNSTTLDVADANVTVNKGGNDATSEGSGLTVERTGTDGSIIYKDASATKYAIGPAGSEIDVVDESSVQTLTNKSISATQLSGTVSITNGGTGQATATPAFDALAPTSGTGEIIYHDGADNVALAQGSNTEILTLIAGVPSWQAPGAATIPATFGAIRNCGMDATVAASALTVLIKQSDGTTDPSTGTAAVQIAYHDAIIANGEFSEETFTAATSVVVPSGATLGHTSGADEFVWVYGFFDGTNHEVAVSASWHDPSILHTTTTMSTGADSKGVLYSTTGRGGVAIKPLARLFSNQATAGTWATAPSNIDLTVQVFNVSEVAAAAYDSGTPSGTVGGNFGASTTTIYDTTDFDTHGAYNTSTGEFTCPVRGFYNVSGQIAVAGTEASNNNVAVYMEIDGAQYSERRAFQRIEGTSLTSTTCQYNFLVPANAGQTLSIRTTSSVGSPVLTVGNDQLYIQFSKIS